MSVEQFSNFPTPNDKDLRACKRCKLVKSNSEFLKNGCDNCDENIKKSKDDIKKQTTKDFHGVIAVLNFEQSWVLNALRIKPTYVKGLYAMDIPRRARSMKE
eukprot:TRINITY_DN2508_c0_g1_i1.p1 TRINITY_DN2508_c0_g1~~TRINITY_DN2508_c0_g1_i1.p1  ORF type:complete len:102 (-),score=44.43 TRINITY_DN2508_c0_g1_i1:58-363(-)